MNSSLAEQLLAARTAKGLSRSHVVNRAKQMHPGVRGLHSTNLVQWERGADGTRSPNPAQLDAWAAALGFEVILQPRAA